MILRIYASDSSLRNLGEFDSYLFHNYKWKKEDPYSVDRWMLEFPDTEQGLFEAMGVHNELHKLRIPQLVKTW